MSQEDLVPHDGVGDSTVVTADKGEIPAENSKAVEHQPWPESSKVVEYQQ